MSPDEFGQIVAGVMHSLPSEFAPYLTNLIVDVEDAPSLTTLRKQGFTDDEIDDGASLYGLFVPFPNQVGSSLGGVDGFDQPLHKIIIYQWPLEEDFPDAAQLRIEIRKTVIHELAHHFGFDERDLERFDARDNPFD